MINKAIIFLGKPKLSKTLIKTKNTTANKMFSTKFGKVVKLTSWIKNSNVNAKNTGKKSNKIADFNLIFRKSFTFDYFFCSNV